MEARDQSIIDMVEDHQVALVVKVNLVVSLATKVDTTDLKAEKVQVVATEASALRRVDIREVAVRMIMVETRIRTVKAAKSVVMEEKAGIMEADVRTSTNQMLTLMVKAAKVVAMEVKDETMMVSTPMNASTFANSQY